MASNLLKNQHLMWRAGFGPAASQLSRLNTLAPSELFGALQKASSKKPEYIDVADSYLKGLFMGAGEIGRQQRNDADKRRVRQQNREELKSLNLYWLDEMVNSDAQLREKMAFFWHGHFACRNINIFYQQQLLQILRQNALGSFRDLLHAVSTSAGILNFLNAAQNKKGHPNENFAREVMELFTLGRGNYSEDDVKEAARAFTGWGANVSGDFVFRKFQHDSGSKTFLGKTGNFYGEDVLDILLDQPQTAFFITRKIYSFFVNGNIDKEKVQWLSTRFYKSDYNIGLLLQDIFSSDWFFHEQNIGVKIKSPIELLVGMRRMLPMQIKNSEVQLVLQRLLGQLLFYPPNVAGWPGGKAWIDSSSLMMRLRLPMLINDRDKLNVQPKADDDQMMGMDGSQEGKSNMAKKAMKSVRPINAAIEWDTFSKEFDGISKDQLLPIITKTLLQTPSQLPESVLKEAIDNSSRENFIRTAALHIMSLPEYQMC